MADHCHTAQKTCQIKALFGSREDLKSTSHVTLHGIWEWAKKIKTDYLMRLRIDATKNVLELRESDFNLKNGKYYPSSSDEPEGVSLFNLFGLIDSNISGDIFLISYDAFRELPKELVLQKDLNIKKPIYHYLIALSDLCKDGLEHSTLAAHLNRFVENQKNKVVDIGVKFDYIPKKFIKNSSDKIKVMKSRIDLLKGSKKFENLFPDLYNELNDCNNIIEEYLKGDKS